MAAPEDKTEDGFETQFGVNHMGHFLLFQLLKPALIASSSPEFNSRVVSLSSSNHRFSGVHLDDLDLKKAGYDPWVSYGQSKTANVSVCFFCSHMHQPCMLFVSRPARLAWSHIDSCATLQVL